MINGQTGALSELRVLCAQGLFLRGEAKLLLYWVGRASARLSSLEHGRTSDFSIYIPRLRRIEDIERLLSKR